MSFDQWADYVESAWTETLTHRVGDAGARAAIATARPMFAMAASQAYEEYVSAWKRHRRKR
jgi:hypothetical protein